MPPRQTVSCGACQHFGKKCSPDECFWAPYFPPDNPEMFIKVHNTFKASNVKKILSQINDPNARKECVRTLAYEAEARLQDPVYGCMGYISRLEQEVANAERELANYVNVGKNMLLSQQMNYNNQHQQMMMGGADQSSSSNYMIYGAAGTTTCQQTQIIMDPSSSSSASGLPPYTSVAPSQTQLIREQSQQHEVGMDVEMLAYADLHPHSTQKPWLETQQYYAATTDHQQELLNQLQQLVSHDLIMQQQVQYGRNATARSPEQQYVLTAVPKAATNHGQELLNQLQQLHSHDLILQQQVHGRNAATARSPEQHVPTAVPKAAHGPGFTDATAPGSTTEISWDSDEGTSAHAHPSC
ncbi:hypothetical protein QQ045_010423 [Rhodiola kirilowii]